MDLKTKEYKNGLSKLEMLDYDQYSSGLIHVKELENVDTRINYHQRIHLEKTRRVNADAVYFRNYPNIHDLYLNYTFLILQ